MKTVLMVIAMVCALQLLHWTFGSGAAFSVALAALSFCIGALWSAGDIKTRAENEIALLREQTAPNQPETGA